MKVQSKHRKIIGLMGAVCLSASLLLIPAYVCRPTKEDATAAAFLTQLICPMTPAISMDDSASWYKCKLYIYNTPPGLGASYQTAELYCRPGQPFSYSQKPLSAQIKPQAYYEAEQRQPPSIPSEPGEYYYYFRFQKPLNMESAFKELAPLYEYSNEEITYGIVWLPIKTEESLAGVTLGLRGNLTTFYTQDLADTESAQDNYHNGLLYKEQRFFEDELRWLENNKKRVEKLEKSGLYGELMPIDFENRHKYVKEHGYQLYGVYAFGDEHLPERIKDRNLILQELYKVKSESPDRVIRQPKKHRN